MFGEKLGTKCALEAWPKESIVMLLAVYETMNAVLGYPPMVAYDITHAVAHMFEILTQFPKYDEMMDALNEAPNCQAALKAWATDDAAKQSRAGGIEIDPDQALEFLTSILNMNPKS